MSTGELTCKDCGAGNTASAKFCYKCGHKLQPATSASITPKRIFWKGFLWGAVGGLVPGVIGLIGLILFESIGYLVAAIVIAVLALGLGVAFLARRSERPFVLVGGILAGAVSGLLGPLGLLCYS